MFAEQVVPVGRIGRNQRRIVGLGENALPDDCRAARQDIGSRRTVFSVVLQKHFVVASGQKSRPSKNIGSIP